jgi:hypothetical protein
MLLLVTNECGVNSDVFVHFKPSCYHDLQNVTTFMLNVAMKYKQVILLKPEMLSNAMHSIKLINTGFKFSYQHYFTLLGQDKPFCNINNINYGLMKLV